MLLGRVRAFLTEMSRQDAKITLFQDNQAAIRIYKATAPLNLKNHVRLRFYALKEAFDEAKVQVKYLETTEMIADVLTKAVGGKLFAKHRRTLLRGG